MQATLFALPEPIQKQRSYAIPVYTVKLVRDGSMSYATAQIRSSKDIVPIMRDYLADTDREHFVVIMLDQKIKVIGINTVSTGSLTASIVHPREVWKPVILSNAAAVILCHNHPSGSAGPSQEDRALTTRLVAGGKLLGINVLDHLIIGDGTGEYFSFADEGLLS